MTLSHAQIQRGDTGGANPPPPKKSQNYRNFSNNGLDLQNKSQSYQVSIPVCYQQKQSLAIAIGFITYNLDYSMTLCVAVI